MPFDTAQYTDVTAEESISGRDGFQFRAASEGFTAQDQARVIDDGVFSPAPGWRGAHGEETSHPQQATYTSHAGRLYFSRARALGHSLNGRPGNQLTVFAVAASADDLAPHNPAQALAADAWDLQKATTRHLDPWVTPLEIDQRFTDEALERLVREDPWAADVLPAFVAMLRHTVVEPDHRVIVQHGDLDVVLQWVALGTMLLDVESALKVTFRGFQVDPWKGDFSVVAVHPELRRLEPGTGWTSMPTVSWIELDTQSVCEMTPGPLDHAAVRWLREDGAFTARNAVEIAHRLMPHTGEDLSVRAAELLAIGELPAPAAAEIATEVIRTLARGGDLDALELYEDELLDPITMHPAHSETDFARAARIVTALLDTGLPGQAAAVAGPTLEALAGAPVHASVFARELGRASVGLIWDDQDARDAAADAWARALDGAPPMDLSALFAATGRLGVPLGSGAPSGAVDALAAQWAADPAVGELHEAWYARDQIRARTAARVATDLAAGDARQGQLLLDGAWDVLLESPGSPLQGWAEVRDIGRRSPEQRAAAIAGRAGAGLPAGSRALVLGQLRLPLDAELVGRFIGAAGVDPAFSSELQVLLAQDRRGVPAARCSGTRWSQVFDALIAEYREHPWGRDGLAVAVEAVDSWRHEESGSRTRTTGHGAGGNRVPDPADADLWALDDIVATGGLIVAERDHAMARGMVERLGDTADDAVDAYLGRILEIRRADAVWTVVANAYRASEGAARDVLGAAARRLLDAHRQIERRVKSSDDDLDLIAQIRAEHAGEDRGFLGRARGWMRGGR